VTDYYFCLQNHNFIMCARLAFHCTPFHCVTSNPLTHPITYCTRACLSGHQYRALFWPTPITQSSMSPAHVPRRLRDRSTKNIKGKKILAEENVVSSSIFDEIIRFCNSPNHFSRTMALGWTQPLTDMSIRNLLESKGWLVLGWQYHRHLWTNCRKCGRFGVSQPYESPRPATGITSTFYV
jgi:hypothetical protein